MTSQLFAQYLTADEYIQHHVAKLRDQQESQLFSVSDRLANWDLDVPEIFEEGFNNAYKKVQHRHNKSKKKNEKAPGQKRSPENTFVSNSGGHFETPRLSQQINFCIDNQKNSNDIPQVKPRPKIPIDSEEFENRKLKKKSQGMESKNILGKSDFAHNIEFDDRSLKKCNSLNFSMQSEDISESLRC